MVEIVTISLYSLTLTYIFLFSMGQLHLVSEYLKFRKNPPPLKPEPDEWPRVTIQLPLYNEKYVVERLLRNIAEVDYPADRLEIQILDDSTDETTEIIQKTIPSLPNASLFQLIRRPHRSGFKAGALAYGLEEASGEFIAIFDSDFMPKPDFLRRTLSQFDENTGVVQTRWGHLNREYSVLTQLQAFGLDAHFTVEQGGRSHANSFINFNGTGGVWRKSCIEQAGGWSDDTLTEDLDLSYRAQLKGWKFKYLEDCVAPAELPVIMSAIKSQQYRWNKGAAETARKNLKKVLTSKVSFTNKFHAFFHLLNSSIFVSLLLAALLSFPVLLFKYNNPKLDPLFYLGSIFLLGFFSIGLLYWVSTKQIHPKQSLSYFIRTFPVFLTVSMGLSLHNGIAVIEGLMGKKSPFIRTPKFNITSRKGKWKTNSYINRRIPIATWLEGLLSLYFLFGFLWGVWVDESGLLIFHAMLSIGFGMVFWHSIRPQEHLS